MTQATKIALVTGASRGIGAAIADTLAQNNIVTIGTATTQQGADAVSERLKAFGADNFGLTMNVNDKISIADSLKRITEQAGAPLILVNNAGITRDNLLMRLSEDDWNDVIDTNLNAVYRITKACILNMSKARYGRIINIGSVVGATGNFGQTNYSAAKAGLMGFTKSLAKEVASRTITVNCIAPGFIDTDMTKKLTEEQRAELKKIIPLKRFGIPQDIADTVMFLINNGSYITGQTLHVNGGMLLT